MRALIALAVAVSSSGCDQLFQVDPIDIVDAPPAADANNTDPPAFVSSGFMNFGDGQLMTDVTVTMARVEAGHLLVVAVCEIPNDPIGNVTDNFQTHYTHAASADSAAASPTLAAQLFYGIAAGTGPAAIAVHFTGIGASSIDVRAAEYKNVDPGAPFDAASGESGLDTTSVTASVVVHAAPALLVATTCVGDQSTGVDGFATRILTNPNGDLLADAIGTTASTEIAVGREGGASGMIVQLAAFRGSA
ncbi:MAG TPA: hypothetical protein VFQ65_05995, partial [Kofleriaceae bacterium]|nr:hypothetical protein [Kofleriaceae bacterium]